jgi:hypothetical protein
LVKAVLATFPGARLDGVRTAGRASDVTVGDSGGGDGGGEDRETEEDGVMAPIRADGDAEDMTDDSADGDRD